MDLATTQEQKDLLAILNASGELGRPFIVAKQVPADRVKMLRAAFAATLRTRHSSARRRSRTCRSIR